MAQQFCCVPRFLARLPIAGDVGADDTCDICQEKYNNSPDGPAEAPVRLPCGHIVGSRCIAHWLRDQNKNTCQYRCRLFPAPEQIFDEFDEDEDDEDDEDSGVDDEYEEEDWPGPDVYYNHDEDLDEFAKILDFLDTSETAQSNGLITRARRERQTYRRILALGATMPPLSPGHLNEVPSAEADALFLEIQRRGAFNVRGLLAIRSSGEVSDRELFDIFRSKGYVWRPRLTLNGRHCASGWTLGNSRYLVTVDTDEVQNGEP